MKIGDPIKAMLHESGEDILVSYRTGTIVQIKDNKIVRIFDAESYQQIGWQREAWQKEAEERKEKQLLTAAENEAIETQKIARTWIELKRSVKQNKKAAD